MDAKLPIPPPRRRSSLFFSKVFEESTPPSDDNHGTTPSSTARKRSLASPKTLSHPSPGHVAQMQKIFQHAKASLHLDARFAASPIGSIDARLPPNQPGVTPWKVVGEDEMDDAVGSSIMNWRYSTTPQLLAAAALDVREPMPDASPTLPELHLSDIVQPLQLDTEPISSGFASPAEMDQDTQYHGYQVSTPEPCPPSTELIATEEEDIQTQTQDIEGVAALGDPMTNLRLADEADDPDQDMEDSPVVAHLKRMSAGAAEHDTPVEDSASSGENIFLSPSAEAAAESAKTKRGLLRGLLNLGARKRVTAAPPPSPAAELVTVEIPCPDPKLHQQEQSLCPDPRAHKICPDPSAHSRSDTPLTYSPPNISVTPAPSLVLSNTVISSPLQSLLHPPAYHHVTSTGSPLMRRPTSSSQQDLPPHPRRTYCSSPGRPNFCVPRSARPMAPGMGQMANEHFEAGWYYAKDVNAPTAYSFTTAAAKVTGAPTDPDSRIRDSYRTDTLTGHFRPTSRFRKTGMAAAVVNHRGVDKYYAGNVIERASGYRATRPKRSRHSPDIRFGSSPPRPMRDTFGSKKRKTEEGSDIIKVDENTRPAVRMSLALKEISSNAVRLVQSSPVKHQSEKAEATESVDIAMED